MPKAVGIADLATLDEIRPKVCTCRYELVHFQFREHESRLQQLALYIRRSRYVR